jgi:hypothetical protein
VSSGALWTGLPGSLRLGGLLPACHNSEAIVGVTGLAVAAAAVAVAVALPASSLSSKTAPKADSAPKATVKGKPKAAVGPGAQSAWGR